MMIFIGILVIGTIAFTKIPIELMPNTSFGEISIIFQVRGGIPPDKVENFVTKPVEEAVGGVIAFFDRQVDKIVDATGDNPLVLVHLLERDKRRLPFLRRSGDRRQLDAPSALGQVVVELHHVDEFFLRLYPHVDMARATIFLPQCIYNEALREQQVALQGAGLYGLPGDLR